MYCSFPRSPLHWVVHGSGRWTRNASAPTPAGAPAPVTGAGVVRAVAIRAPDRVARAARVTGPSEAAAADRPITAASAPRSAGRAPPTTVHCTSSQSPGAYGASRAGRAASPRTLRISIVQGRRVPAVETMEDIMVMEGATVEVVVIDGSNRRRIRPRPMSAAGGVGGYVGANNGGGYGGAGNGSGGNSGAANYAYTPYPAPSCRFWVALRRHSQYSLPSILFVSKK